MPIRWTEETVARLIELWSEKKNGKWTYSATGISKILDCSRNAVIGKIHRLGITIRGSGTNNGSHQRRNLVIEQPIVEETYHSFNLKESLCIPFMDIRPFQCRAVMEERGRDGLALFCGLPTLEDSSYCNKHHERFHYYPPGRNYGRVRDFTNPANANHPSETAKPTERSRG